MEIKKFSQNLYRSKERQNWCEGVADREAQTAEDVTLESMEKEKANEREKAGITRTEIIDAFWSAKEKLDHMDTHGRHLSLMLEKLFGDT